MCFNKCENGGMAVVNEEDVCGCKCPTGLKGDDCSQLDTSLCMYTYSCYLFLLKCQRNNWTFIAVRATNYRKTVINHTTSFCKS